MHKRVQQLENMFKCEKQLKNMLYGDKKYVAAAKNNRQTNSYQQYLLLKYIDSFNSIVCRAILKWIVKPKQATNESF